MKYVICIFILILTAGCGKSLETQAEELVLAKNLWIASSAGKDYKYTASVSGSGSETFSREYFVQNGDELIDNKNNVPVSTMKNLFMFIFENIKDEDIRVEVNYDEKLGFPSYVRAIRPGSIHGTLIIELSKVEIL